MWLMSPILEPEGIAPPSHSGKSISLSFTELLCSSCGVEKHAIVGLMPLAHPIRCYFSQSEGRIGKVHWSPLVLWWYSSQLVLKSATSILGAALVQLLSKVNPVAIPWILWTIAESSKRLFFGFSQPELFYWHNQKSREGYEILSSDWCSGFGRMSCVMSRMGMKIFLLHRPCRESIPCPPPLPPPPPRGSSMFLLSSWVSATLLSLPNLFLSTCSSFQALRIRTLSYSYHSEN